MNIKFQNPGIYRITIQGGTSHRWVNQFAEYIINQKEIDEGNFRTVLKMDIKDQAHLSGILNSFYDLHLSIIEVKILAPKPNNNIDLN